MNLILFEETTEFPVLAADDPRALHIRDVLGMKKGDRFDVGLINGPRGKAAILSDDLKQGLALKIEWGKKSPTHLPFTLLVGLPRPQTARRILREGASLGLERILFFEAEKGEPSYGKSKLWSTGEWRRHLIQGAEQAFTTYLPEVSQQPSLPDALKSLGVKADRIALDVYEAEIGLAALQLKRERCILAVGAERGWSPGERVILVKSGFTLVHLGERVLRTETATIAAVSILAAKMGLM